MAIHVKHETYSDKNAELIIYISSRLKDKPKYGVTLLGKSLCLIDSMNYLKTGKAISNFEYIKQEFGPTPESSKFLDLIQTLLANDELKRIEVPYYGRIQIKYLANRKPNIDVFTKDEIFLINDVLESVSDISAADISVYTHTFISWVFAKNKEVLPFYTFLLTKKEPEIKDIQWAQKLVKHYEKKNKKPAI